jgi:uncharacterized protein YaaN involved in tellurite resistance
MPETNTAIQVAFPPVAASKQLVLPPAVETPINSGLAAVVVATPAGATPTLSCKDLLVGDTLAQAQAEAADLYPKMKDSTPVFTAYGTKAIAEVNSFSERLLHEVAPVKSEEIRAIVSGLMNNMRSINRDYDVSDPKVREKYEKWSEGLRGWLRHGRTFIDELMDGVTSIEHKIDKVKKELEERQYDLEKNLVYYDELYEENEAAIAKLIYAIAVMEIICDMAGAEAASIVVGDAARGDRGEEQRAKVADFGHAMELKIADYKGRLFIAWATSPQVRMMRSLNVGLVRRIDSLVQVGIPTMKLTIAQWEMMVQTMDAAELAEAVSASINETLQGYAKAAATAVPLIAKANEFPTLQPATIAAMADSLVKQSDGIIAVMEQGETARREADAAILAGHAALSDAATRVSDAVVAHIVGQATKAIEVSTSVPAA